MTEVRTVVQFLFVDTPELPAILDAKFLLGVAVDREVVGDNGGNGVVLDAQGPVLGVDRVNRALVFEVQSQAVWLRRNRHRDRLRLRLLLRRLGLLDRRHGSVCWLWLLHHRKEAAEETAEAGQSPKKPDPPGRSHVHRGDGRTHLLVGDALLRLQRLLLRDRAPARGGDVDEATEPPPTSRQRHLRDGLALLNVVAFVHVVLLEDRTRGRVDAHGSQALDLHGRELPNDRKVLVLHDLVDLVAGVEVLLPLHDGTSLGGLDGLRDARAVFHHGDRIALLHGVAHLRLPLLETPLARWCIRGSLARLHLQRRQLPDRGDVLVLQDVVDGHAFLQPLLLRCDNTSP
mmetsp:Transcript_75373/g.170634  ORF Transcript_75373/g.170634 Transcript_75373/m.170634 type:complete len:345 (-) Transcript_75373:343-1377(-)